MSEDVNFAILQGDCLEKLKELPDNSVDSLVTDPPAGISFMGKEWDDDKGGREQWISWLTEVMKECNRVLKPGAHALVWAIPRTSHWTATAIENAGFEIRDVVTHLFGSGFPKSLDVSKAIDKAAGAEREVIGVSTIGGGGASNSKGFKADAESQSGGSFQQSSDGKNGLPITAPSTPEAKQWQGFGTALKPAAEFWVLARKPLSEKTVAANVLKWGTGALNIDGSRIELDSTVNLKAKQKSFDAMGYGGNKETQEVSTYNASGRFPANLVFSHTEHCTYEQCDIECAVKQLDEQSGTLKNGGQNSTSRKGDGMFMDGSTAKGTSNFAGDSGGASRFFYCAKVSSKERNAGMPEGQTNGHPTVKAQKLMSYLIKLITPPGGLVLDPFMGSGSTGCAALTENFGFLGIEQNPEYAQIAELRLDYYSKQKPQPSEEIEEEAKEA